MSLKSALFVKCAYVCIIYYSSPIKFCNIIWQTVYVVLFYWTAIVRNADILHTRIFTENIVMDKYDTYTMNRLEEGRWGRVIRLDTKGSMRRRLQDIGLVEGTMVRCLRRSPSGDPAAFLIRGAVIALRNETSSEILVE